MLSVIHGSWYSADSAWVQTWALFISFVSWTCVHTKEHIHTVYHFTYACPHIIFTCLTRSTQASFFLTRMWKQESRWRWLGCRETPRRNIAPSGPPHPTPLTQCGMRSLLFLRRCVGRHTSDIYMLVNVFQWAKPLQPHVVAAALIFLLLLWWIDPAPRNGLSKNCGPWRER